jgi:uncharacterized membrane protein YccF (DUF307 family)
MALFYSVVSVTVIFNFHLINFHLMSRAVSNDYLNEAKNIVDGNRDRTLFLLWQILYGYELKMVRSFFAYLMFYFIIISLNFLAFENVSFLLHCFLSSIHD